MAKEIVAYFGKLPEGAGNAFKYTVGSVTAGVGGVFNGPDANRPDVLDLTSQEAFDQYKEYNTNTNLRTNQRRMWGTLVDRIAGNVMFAAAAAIGVGSLSTAGPVVGALVFLGAIGVAAGAFFAFQQTSNREQTDKGMDVDDYRLKRSAGLIAQEIKKALQEDKSPSQTTEVLIVKEAVNENKPNPSVSANSGDVQGRLAEALKIESARV